MRITRPRDAQGQPDPDLAGALAHQVRDHSIDADAA